MLRFRRFGKKAIIYCKKRIRVFKIKITAKGKNPKLYYFGVPEHPNMGDLGQYYCVSKWLKSNYAGYTIVECPSSIVLDKKSGFRNYFERAVTKDDLLVIHSGYNTNDLSEVSNQLNLFLMSNYQDCKLIVLPQTVFFKEKENMIRSGKVFNARRNMVFMARDNVSYAISREMMPDNHVLMIPDIVTTLIGSREEKLNRSGIVLCHRNDGEMLYNNEDFYRLKLLLENVDSCVIMDTTVTKTYRQIMKDLFSAMLEIIKQFESSRIVITDRYHGMIYSLVANTPVIVLKTTDHKVVEGYNILKKIYPERIWFAESIESAAEQCKSILDNPHYDKLDNFFDREIFAKLSSLIEQELSK